MPNSLPHPLNEATRKFIDLHGDRIEQDDHVVSGGLAWIGDRRCVLVYPEAGESGEAFPPGIYRKLSRLVAIAQQAKRPLIFWAPEVYLNQQATSLLHSAEFQQFAQDLLCVGVPTIAFVNAPSLDIVDCQRTIESVVSPAELLESLEEVLPGLVSDSHDGRMKRRQAQLQNALDNIPGQ